MIFKILLLAQFSYAFPIWGLCKKDFKKGFTNKPYVVQVWAVDNKCVWVTTNGRVLLTKKKDLVCIPQNECAPLFGRTK